MGTELHLWHFKAPGFGVGFVAGFGVVSVGFGVDFGVGFGEGFGVDGRGPSCMLQLKELQRQIYTLMKYIIVIVARCSLKKLI